MVNENELIHPRIFELAEEMRCSMPMSEARLKEIVRAVIFADRKLQAQRD